MVQLIFIKNWDFYLGSRQSASQEEFWMGELKAFLDNPAKREMAVESGEFSFGGYAYGGEAIQAGKKIVTSPVRLLKKCGSARKVLVKTKAGYTYCIREDGYNRGRGAKYNAFVAEFNSRKR